MVVEIKTYEEFKKIIQENKNVLVDCYAVWCGPCRMLAPTIEKISDQLTDIKFYKLDVDRVGEVGRDYDINAIPALLCIKEGQLVNKLVGFRDQQTLTTELNKIF